MSEKMKCENIVECEDCGEKGLCDLAKERNLNLCCKCFDKRHTLNEILVKEKEFGCKHISKVLDIIRKIWMKYPNLRLGQLLMSAYPYDLFYVEDENLLKYLCNINFSVTKKEKK